MRTCSFAVAAATLGYLGVVRASSSQCDNLAPGPCDKMDGCLWFSSEKVCKEDHTSQTSVCSARLGNACEETDDSCMMVKGKCLEVNRGVGTEGHECTISLEDDGFGNLVYAEADNLGCAAGFVCIVEDTYTSTAVGVPLPGKCQPTECYGRKVAGSCSEKKPGCELGTNRTTICHRTCSETNPWVRITIDDDAWDVCGHKQHTIDPTCNGKDLSIWGANKNDYKIKTHGTRAEVAARLKTPQAIKEYWRKWEHACPYVRNGECCSWDDEENPCCGEPPAVTPSTPVPETKSLSPGPEDCLGVQEELYAVNEVLLENGKSLGRFPSVDDFPVRVVSTDGSTVTFEVCNKLANGRVFAGFVENGDYVCYETDEDNGADCVEYTADCYLSEPFAVVDIHLTSPVVDVPVVTVPKCCHDDAADPMSAVYTFLLKCECPSEMS